MLKSAKNKNVLGNAQKDFISFKKADKTPFFSTKGSLRSEQSSLDACPRSEQSSSPLFSGCAEKAQFLRQARRQLVLLQDRAVLQRTPWLLEPGNVKRSSCSPVSPVARSSPGGMAVGRRGASVEALAVREYGLSRCASDEACGVGDGTLVGGLKRSKAVEGADEPDAAIWTATAGEREGIIRLHEVTESDFPPLLRSSQSPDSRPGSLSSACARSVARRVAAAPARVCPGSSSPAVSAAVAHAHASILHGALVNSWSDTVRLHGPTGTRRVKGGVSSPAEDLRPVSEVEAGVNFRPAGRCSGTGCRFYFLGGNRATGTRPNKGKCGHTFPPPGGS